MAIVRVNSSAWSSGDVFRAAQANSLDLNSTYALDKRSGQTDTIQSVITCTGAGRIISSFIAGADANTTYQADGGNTMISVTALTSSRTYSLSATNALAGDVISIANYNASFPIQVNDQSATRLVILFGGSIATSPTSQFRSADFMYDGTAWRVFRVGAAATLVPIAFTASGTFTPPVGCSAVVVAGCGGAGGGGGGGGGSSNNSTNGSTGGGGGGGAVYSTQILQVTPGAGVAVTVGTGGTGGGGGAIGGFGSGGNTGVASAFGTLTFPPGQGGGGGQNNNSASIAAGGQSVAQGSVSTMGNSIAAATASIQLVGVMGSPGVGCGGFSATLLNAANASSGGGASATGFAGGGAGNNGTNSTGLGGGGGGGGGGGAFGAGAQGGAGGNGGTVVAGSSTGGTAGVANTGAGGGGGGGGGSASGAAGTVGGAGGAGGSGYLLVLPIR